MSEEKSEEDEAGAEEKVGMKDGDMEEGFKAE